MATDFYEVDSRTIDNYLSLHEDELKHNGYFLCKGNLLKDFKLQFGHENNFVTKITQLGLFDFRAFLNIGMLSILDLTIVSSFLIYRNHTDRTDTLLTA